MTLTTTRNKEVVVDKAYHWIPITDKDHPFPGSKVQLINRWSGVATYGSWTPGSEWTHYAGLPTFHPDDKTGLRDA